MDKIAILIGATGLVGSRLLQKLLADETFSKVKVFGRTSTGITHDKLSEKNILFSNLELIKGEVTGDVLFSCLGTTRKQAGSKSNQYKVDFTYQYQFAKFASQNNVADYFLVSSTGADSTSMFFYSRMKGELEVAIRKLRFERIVILQPSVLSGKRKDERSGEKWVAKLINAFAKVFPFLKKYRSISGDTVADALIAYYKQDHSSRINVHKLDELHQAAIRD